MEWKFCLTGHKLTGKWSEEMRSLGLDILKWFAKQSVGCVDKVKLELK